MRLKVAFSIRVNRAFVPSPDCIAHVPSGQLSIGENATSKRGHAGLHKPLGYGAHACVRTAESADTEHSPSHFLTCI